VAPGLLTAAATGLAHAYPELYRGALLSRIEWVGRVAEQCAYWADSRGAWGVMYREAIVAHWAHATLELWRFPHDAGAVVPLPCEASGRAVFVDVRPTDWLGVGPLLRLGAIEAVNQTRN
jgi:hypothetical protein